MNWRDALSGAAQRRPDETAFSFHDDDGNRSRLTYAGLDERARAVGTRLLDLGLGGRPVPLFFPAGLDYVAAFFGCLYAGAIAVPAYPPNRNPRSIDRVVAIVRDCGADTALTTAALRDRLGPRLSGVPELSGLRLTPTDDWTDAGRWQPPALAADAVAFLQYTSGSTAAPRGVVLDHGNLLANTDAILRLFELDEHMRGVSWLPMYHDMGLIGSVLGTVRAGGRMALLAPATFARDPYRWLKLISDERATVSGGPNFAYDLAAARIDEAQRAGLDLSSWRVAYNGAEPLRADTLDRFAATFAGSGFRRSAFLPCYGLAESSLLVSAEKAGAGHRTWATDGRELVSSGAEHAERIEIVEPRTGERVPDGREGEVWLAGPSVARGYYRRPAETAETFGARLAGEETAFLRTGDLAIREAGALYITGRRKDLIIIRGRNHYPQDIERTVEDTDPALVAHGGAAFSVTGAFIGGEEQLVVVHELRLSGEPVDVAALAARVRDTVAAQHEVRPSAVVLIRQGTLPRTSSGKVARHAARAAYQAGSLTELGRTSEASKPAPALTGDAVAEALRGAVAEQLGRPADTIDLDTPMVSLGLDSLGLLTVQHTVQRRLGLTRFADDAMYAGIREIAAEAVAAPPAQQPAHPAITPADEDHPLSPAQRGIWFLHQLAPDSSAYLVSGAAEVHGRLDSGALRRAVNRLVARHAALRTTFPAGAEGPRQHVHADLAPAFAEVDATGWADGELAAALTEAAYAPMDVQDGPLLRITVLRTGEDRHRLVVAAHHLVCDLWSMQIMLTELDRLYRAETGGPAADVPPVTGFATAAAGRAAELDTTTDSLWDFWRERLDGAPATLELPTDRRRPPEQRFRGDVRRFAVDPGTADRLAELARESGATLFTVLLSAYQVLLARYTGQRDVLVGSPVHGRRDASLAGVVGTFVNTVPLRARIDPRTSFRDLLRTAATEVPAMLAHGDLPLPTLVERMQLPRDPSRSPLVQALFTVQGAAGGEAHPIGAFVLGDPAARLRLGDLELRPVPLSGGGAQLDLQLTFARTESGLAGMLQYAGDLFDDVTADRMVGHVNRLLAAVTTDPDQPVGALPLLGDDERHLLLEAGNDTAADTGADRLVHERVAEQARRIPHAPAVSFDDANLILGDPELVGRVRSAPTLTYAELDAAANRLAHLIRARGIGLEDIVGVHLPRSLDMAVALLGVLRAGGTYLPIDPDLPADRKQLMFEDSGAKLLITHATLRSALDAGPALCLDEETDALAAQPETPPAVRIRPGNVAYVLYTSGSTGRPKGVHVMHSGFVNFQLGMLRLFGRAAQGRVLAISRFSFDISGLDLFLPLLAGGTAHIVSTAIAADGTQLRARLETGRFKLLQATPTAWQLIFDAGWRGTPGLTMLSGAEALPPALADRLLATGGVLWNLYGPTETTVWSAALRVSGDDDRIAPIGPPIANTTFYVLDQELRPVPIGVTGELFIGGAGLARGYLNRPGLTADRFVPDPYAGAAGERMYRTGDLARVLADGRLEFLGRADNQVKVNGHRIELGEIEAALGRHPIVRRAVMAVHTAAGTPVLVAYVQPRNRIDAGAFDRGAANKALREELAKSLPPYMVPLHYVWLSAFPLTPSGKIDRKQLPEPELSAASRGPAEPPATATEKALSDIVLELLDVPVVGRRDNLFDHGAHSLMVSRLSLRIRESFGVQIPLHQLFDGLSVERLGALVDDRAGSAAAAPVTRVDRSSYARTVPARRSRRPAPRGDNR